MSKNVTQNTFQKNKKNRILCLDSERTSRRNARRREQPLAKPGFIKNVLEFKATRRRQLFKRRWQCRARKNVLVIKPTRRRQLLKCRWQCRTYIALENQTDATPSAFKNAAGNAGQKSKLLEQNRRDAVSWCLID
jgi:hypothetical protein